MVLVLAARITKLSVGAARALFLAYAVLTGLVFSTYFLLFDVMSMILVFAVTALYFGVMALFGYFTTMTCPESAPFWWAACCSSSPLACYPCLSPFLGPWSGCTA